MVPRRHPSRRVGVSRPQGQPLGAEGSFARPPGQNTAASQGRSLRKAPAFKAPQEEQTFVTPVHTIQCTCAQGSCKITHTKQHKTQRYTNYGGKMTIDDTQITTTEKQASSTHFYPFLCPTLTHSQWSPPPCEWEIKTYRRLCI